MKDIEIDTIKKVRAILPNNLHLGGSKALKRFFYETPLVEPDDIDLFYYGDRPMERWALLSLFTSLGFVVLKAFNSYDGEYKIPGQYWYFKLQDSSNQVIFDLIFIHEDEIDDSLGSSLAGVQYRIDYSDKMFVEPIYHALRKQMRNVREGLAYYAKSKNTESQIEKIIDRCNKLDLHLMSTD